MPPKKSKTKLPVHGQKEIGLSRPLLAHLPIPSLPPHNHSIVRNSLNRSKLATVSPPIFDASSPSSTGREPPPDNIADDPFGVTDPYGVKETRPLVDRGEIWYIIDNSKRREEGRKKWEEAQHVDPSAKAEDLWPEPPDQFVMSYQEWSQRRVDELLRHREARHCGIINDEDIHDAFLAGPAFVEKLRDRERRSILDRDGIPPKRPIRIEDIDTLYENYVKLLGSPGHKVPGCNKCETASAHGRLYSYTIIKMTCEGGKSDEKWHYPSKKEANKAERACDKFLLTLVGFARQEKKAKENLPIIAENIQREKDGKKPIPLNETRVEKLVREIEEGIRTAPSTENDPEPETEEEAAKRWDEEVQASQEIMKRVKTEEDEQRTKIAWQRHKSRERYLQMRTISTAEDLERPSSKFSNHFPIGLPYKGKLVHERSEIEPEDWTRLKENRAAFEEAEGQMLPAGPEKEKWDKYIGGILENYRPPRGLLTSEPKASQ
ncbi:MAG: hypothetical protein L6R41_001315 [Letrouitia leprolyta]|nr:MAG: hypothetical protein L6R41_001315 [Letrouitia leprolyta]